MGISFRPEQIRAKSRRSLQTELHPPSSTPDMVYDFSGLSRLVTVQTKIFNPITTFDSRRGRTL